jgi:hypothetical protein
VRAAAVRVLAFRGVLRESDWCAATRDDDGAVKMAALSVPCRGFDTDVCERHLEPLLAAHDELLVAAALRAGVGTRAESARHRALAIARRDPSWADALHCLAMFGRLKDAEHVEAALADGATSAALRAAATLGAVSLVRPLLAYQGSPAGAPQAHADIRAAVTAITGLPFSDTSDPPSAWQLWDAHADAFEPRSRYRVGQVFSPALLLHLLREGGSQRRGERQLVYLELLAATRSPVPRFSPYDFVRVQVDALQRIETWLAGTSQGPASS